MSRRRRPRPGPLPPRGQSCYIGAAVEGLSLLASGAEESPSAVPPPKVSPPSPSAGKACPFEPPFETRGKAVSQLASIPSSHMQPPAEGGFCLDSLRLNSPRPRQRPDPQPTGKHLPPPNRRPQSLSGAQGPSCCRRATPCQPPPLESAGSKPSSPPSGARRHPPSTWSACHSFAPMAVEPTG
ncbi:hypothetical protein N7447_004674 [Penicillium robsamsonii]|uniref:uncharacterized protein n=1 Tax=Penicillium robsamsonii TaxID=1792511 RepID=UPI002548188E|nr:uncharacterized protein N7447_011288 [Penicillium robsamsonii]XP_057080298.1 uncharacterized protein N7447_011322 [Penicillium robsamsonii]XP_057088287.1 uncharacterized protein N7447_004674 [Penicillium robsamsonii]KAJ5807161.1 hypothetical protein N7447_011288 [Penicillium robsamsonii]KAJ5807195.1 hypothetical protein N7447_011322 [Penicillium robsamsonii]KAJ5827911.1 hypothetical protein N7447_004674 [Penicillium robsamsonii]